MRETLDCGVLMVPAHAEWMRAWMERHAADMARVRLYAINLDDGGVLVASVATGMASAYMGAPAAAHSLARLAMPLRRFDACLLPVTPETLGWTRTALSCARDALSTPLIGVARGLKAAAVEDLLALGMRDFMRDPLCPEELRVRVDRVAGGKRAVSASPAGVAPAAGPDQARSPEGASSYATSVGTGVMAAEPAMCEPASRYGLQGAGAAAALSVASAAIASARSASLSGDARPRLSRDAIDSGLLAIQAAPRIHPDEPFRIAKSRVVDSFERDYVRTALSRHAGNVARAARASSKHRRAFWALMRKHHIDAAPYRARQERKEELD